MSVYHDRNHIFSDVQKCLEATIHHRFFFFFQKKMQFWNKHDSRVQKLLNLKSNNTNVRVLTEDGVFIGCWLLMISIYHATGSK